MTSPWPAGKAFVDSARLRRAVSSQQARFGGAKIAVLGPLAAASATIGATAYLRIGEPAIWLPIALARLLAATIGQLN